jgi:type 1 fimbriae regulatory protein FimB
VGDHPRNKAVFLTAYRNGLRASEIGLLRTDDLDFKRLRIMLHRLKGSYSGEHPMQPDEAKVLKAHLRERTHESPILFTSNRNDPISRRTLDWLMNHCCPVKSLAVSRKPNVCKGLRRYFLVSI